jgi:nucleotide-binding universal stress UspA family protein
MARIVPETMERSIFMLTRILVPLDGSELAERALAVAAKLARQNNGSLILVQALETPITYDAWIPASFAMALPDREREAQAYLTRQAKLPMLSSIPTRTDVSGGAAAQAILNTADEYRADMIVMTSHGRSGLSHWVFGSVAEHVARQAKIPVLVLRQSQFSFWVQGAELVNVLHTPSSKVAIPDLRLLVPLDGSPLAEAALEPAASCALSLVRGVEKATGAAPGSVGCRLHLALIVRPFETLAENMPETLVLTGAEAYLQRVAEQMRTAHPGLEVTWEVYAANDVAGSLVRLLQDDKTEEPFTLLAMATHGRTGVMRWIWGSITERVIHKTQLPLLVVRPSSESITSGLSSDKKVRIQV